MEQHTQRHVMGFSKRDTYTPRSRIDPKVWSAWQLDEWTSKWKEEHHFSWKLTQKIAKSTSHQVLIVKASHPTAPFSPRASSTGDVFSLRPQQGPSHVAVSVLDQCRSETACNLQCRWPSMKTVAKSELLQLFWQNIFGMLFCFDVVLLTWWRTSRLLDLIFPRISTQKKSSLLALKIYDRIVAGTPVIYVEIWFRICQ